MVITMEQRITSQLVYKRIAAYLKKKDRVTAERLEDGTFLLSDGLLMVHVPSHPDLFPYVHFSAEWERATFRGKSPLPTEGAPDGLQLWTRLQSEEVIAPLVLTHYLYECAGARNAPGILYRKLFFLQDEQEHITWIDKRMTDLLSPDVDELEGFLYESTSYRDTVRVSAVNGIAAYLMPATLTIKE